MQGTSNGFRNSHRSLAQGTWVGLAAIITLGLVATAVNAQKPAVVVSQSSVMFDVQGGGCPNACSFTAGMTPNGGGFGVDGWGDIAISMPYGNVTDVYNGTTGTVTTITSVSNQAGATFDSQRNLYVGPLYKHKLIKIPFVNGAWVAGNPDAAPACTGNDTVECGMPNLGTDYNTNPDYKNTAFDASSNLFMVTATDDVHGGNKIYMLPAASLYTSTPTLILSDEADHVIASIAFDPWGNLFFTDVVYSSGGQHNQHATSAYLNVLPYSGTAYAAAKTVLVTHTIASPGDYDNALSGVTVDRSGTVYFSDLNGTYAIPNNPATPAAAANAYLVSTTGRQAVDDGWQWRFICGGLRQWHAGSHTYPAQQCCGSRLCNWHRIDREYHGGPERRGLHWQRELRACGRQYGNRFGRNQRQLPDRLPRRSERRILLGLGEVDSGH